jgi:hypothetical protein
MDRAGDSDDRDSQGAGQLEAVHKKPIRTASRCYRIPEARLVSSNDDDLNLTLRKSLEEGRADA